MCALIERKWTSTHCSSFVLSSLSIADVGSVKQLGCRCTYSLHVVWKNPPVIARRVPRIAANATDETDRSRASWLTQSFCCDVFSLCNR